MPSKTFSGKQKKQQLQERRARKKDKKPLGADTSSSGSDDDGSGAEDHHHTNTHQQHGEYKEKFQKGGGSHRGGAVRGGRGGGGRGGRGGRGNNNTNHHDGDDADTVDGAASTANNDVYGKDKKGVRSEFKKEHKREVKERQQANYAPLVERDFMDADKGIPFGQWFKVSNLAARRQYDTTVDGVTMGEGGYSSTFLYSIALPRRARMTGEDGKDIFANIDDDSDDYDQGPRGGRGGRGVGRGGRGGGRGGKGSGKGGHHNNHHDSDDSTTTTSSSSASSSSSSSSCNNDNEDTEEATNDNTNTTTSNNNNAKAIAKTVKDRLQAATEYDARERHVFRHWMNHIDRTFGVAHDARLAAMAADDDKEAKRKRHEALLGLDPTAAPTTKDTADDGSDASDDDNDDAANPSKKQKRNGRRNRAVHKANNADAIAAANVPPPPHPLAHLELNLFERNIDVWRQLWRTVENSDVVIAVADARYPIVHLPISLFMHVIGEQGKPMVVVLNKVDLMKEALLVQWEGFLRKYWDATLKPLLPADKHALVDQIVICRFTCSPEAGTALAKGDESATSRRKKKAPRNAKLYEELKAGESKKGQSAYAPSRRELKGNRFDYAADAKRAKEEAGGAGGSSDEDNLSETSSSSDSDAPKGSKKDPTMIRAELLIVKRMIDDILSACKRLGLGLGSGADIPAPADQSKPVHIGFVGHPNVGKSSLINCIKGAKVVSVSSTAGHTKHLQTVPLLADGVVLIDCPGLAFPVLGLPKPMQAVLGTHQIAQTRDPQSGVGYLGARLQLERIYNLRKLNHNPREVDTEPWSAYELCEAYGCKKGYHVKKGKGAIDVHRAAIGLLSEAYDGRLVLFFATPTSKYLQSPAFANTVRQYLYLDPEWVAPK